MWYNVDMLRKELAAEIHEIWGHRMRHMLSGGKEMVGGVLLLEQDVSRWRRQMETEYANLADEEKASDLEQADKIVEVIDEWYS